MNKELIIHSSAIQISNKITLLQRKAWNILLFNAFNDLPNKETFTIYVKDMEKLLGYESNNEEHLKESLKSLMSCLVEWNIFKKDRRTSWKASTLLAFCSVENGICKYQYSPFLREKLYNPEVYVKIKLLMQNRFKTKYSLILYSLCLDYFSYKNNYGETPTIALDNFRKFMGLAETEYLRFKDLNYYLINAPIKEINESSDICVNVEYKKERRKVTGLKFYIKRNNNKDAYKTDDLSEFEFPQQINPKLIESPKPEININLSGEQKHIFDKLFEIGITKISANELIKNYSLDNIRNQIEWLKYRNPNDAAAMLIQSIKEDWTIPNEAKKIIEEETEFDKLQNLLKQARNSTNIILPNGKKCKISSIQENGYIEIIGEHNRKYMVQPGTAFESKFE